MIRAKGWAVRSRVFRILPSIVVAAVVALSFARPAAAIEGVPSHPPSDRWLSAVNYYRATAGLPRVAADPALNVGAKKHAEYMVRNDVVGHTEQPGFPLYSVKGNEAGTHSNVGGWWGSNPTERDFVEMWMTGPFHALGILRPHLKKVGFGMARDRAGLTSAAALDVIHGLSYSATTSSGPVVWPGDGSSQPLGSYVGGEYPDPLSSCRGYSAPSGLPIIVQFTEPVRNPSFTFETSHGESLSACDVDATSYRNPNDAAEALGRSLLAGENVVLVIPKRPLDPGKSYAVTVTSGRETVTSHFSISR